MTGRRLFAAGLAILTLSACNKPATEAPKPIRPVLSMKVLQSTAAGLALAGTVQPRVQTTFGFRVLGRMIARPVNVGDLVGKDQILAAIDPVALKFVVQSAAAELASAEATLANAIGVEERQSTLQKSGATTQAQLEAAEQARAAAQATATRARAALAKAREQFNYAVLKSDFAGIVTSVGAEVGQTVSPGEAIVTVAEPGTRDAVIDIPDAFAGGLALGQRFTVALQLAPTILAAGAIREIAPAADAATRTRRVKIALDDPPGTFRLGSTITASLASGQASSFRLPASALLEKDGRDYVWVVDPKSATVSKRAITITARDQGFIDVGGGLEPQTRVVIAGVHGLAEGQQVKIDSEPAL